VIPTSFTGRVKCYAIIVIFIFICTMLGTRIMAACGDFCILVYCAALTFRNYSVGQNIRLPLLNYLCGEMLQL